MAANYDIRPLQLRILRILKEFDRVCCEHGLRYYIVDGTMLGAVRHGGFIPWDDDIDVGMPRRDYETLVKHASEWLPEPYELVCDRTDDRFILPFAKIQDAGTTLIQDAYYKYVGGVSIDVFPLDGMVGDVNKQKRFWRRTKMLRLKALYYTFREPFKRGFRIDSIPVWIYQRFVKIPDAQRWLRRHQSQYPYEGSALVINHDDWSRGIMPREYYGEPVPIVFEGETFMGVAMPREYLTQLYGDYMQLPPEDNRITHPYVYLDLGKPYCEYKG